VIHVPRDTGLQLNRRPGRLQAGRRPPNIKKSPRATRGDAGTLLQSWLLCSWIGSRPSTSGKYWLGCVRQ
jgi:hypothetical protein